MLCLYPLQPFLKRAKRSHGEESNSSVVFLYSTVLSCTPVPEVSLSTKDETLSKGRKNRLQEIGPPLGPLGRSETWRWVKLVTGGNVPKTHYTCFGPFWFRHFDLSGTLISGMVRLAPLWHDKCLGLGGRTGDRPLGKVGPKEGFWEGA